MSIWKVWLRGVMLAGLLLSACAPAASSPTAAPAKPTDASKPADSAKPAGSPAAAPAKPGTMTKLSLGHGAISATDAPWWVAADQGIYAKYGLEIDDVTLTGGSQVSQALASGSVPIAS